MRTSLPEPSGPYQTAATTAAMIGILGMAGGSAVSAVVQSNAAKKAAQIQANSAQTAINAQTGMSQQALDFAKQQWAQSQANMAPYLAMGRGALSTLGGLMGISPDPTVAGGSPGGGAMPTGGGASVFMPGSGGTGNGASVFMPGGGMQSYGNPVAGKPLTLGGLYAPSGNGSGGAPPMMPTYGNAAPPPPPQTASNTGGAVRIAWPDGSQQTVSSDQLPQYLNLGAQPVNG